MNDINDIIAERIKEARQKLNLSQKELAEKLSITAPSLSRYETGSGTPSIPILIELSKVCNVSVDWLLGLTNTSVQQNAIKTYADLIKVLVDISRTPLEIEITTAEYTTLPNGQDMRTDLGGVLFQTNYKELEGFLEDWRKMYDLFKGGAIDREVYNLWLEKTLIKFNSINIDVVEEGLPF